MVIYYYYYPALCALNISFYLALYHPHSIITIQFSHILQLSLISCIYFPQTPCYSCGRHSCPTHPNQILLDKPMSHKSYLLPVGYTHVPQFLWWAMFMSHNSYLLHGVILISHNSYLLPVCYTHVLQFLHTSCGLYSCFIIPTFFLCYTHVK